jgi:outer membrane autotransporter protein
VFVDGSIGATTIDINGGGTVAGTGTLAGAVTVMSDGTLMPGHSPGTLTVTGSLTFNAGSFYSVHVTPSAASATTIGGSATINGGTVVVTLQQAGNYNNKTYTIVTSTGPLTGTFSGGVTLAGGIKFNGTESLSYDAHDVFLTLSGSATQTLTAPGNLSVDQQNVFNAINSAIGNGTTLPPGFQNLLNLSGAQLANALTQLDGEANAAFLQGAFQAGNSFLNLMINPFLDGRFGNGGGFGAAMGFAAEDQPALAQAALAFASAMPVKAPPAATLEQRFSAWGAAYGGSGRVLGDATLGSHDTTATAAAFAAGIDYRLAPDTIVGVALAGGGTGWTVDAGLGAGSSDMFQAGVYGSHRWGAAYISGALAYNFHDVTTKRTVTVAATDMLEAHFQANGVGARIEGGYRYATPWVGITPYAAVQVQSIALPSYTESATAGSNQFALSFASQTATTTRTELGAWLDRRWLLDNGGLLTLYGRAAWAHDNGNSPSASAIFQALPGSNFIVDGAVPARDGALVTGAAQYALVSGWAFLAKFDGEFSSTTAIYTGSGMVRKTW